MSYASLLIGFEDWKTLPGIPGDLYQAYKYSQNITKNIIVFTDLYKDYHLNCTLQLK